MVSPRSPIIQQLNRLDKSSPDFPCQLNAILRGEEYEQLVANVKGGDLTWLVDYLDEVLDGLDPSNATFNNCLSALRGLCGANTVIPTSCTSHLSDLTKINSSKVVLSTFNIGEFAGEYQATLCGSKVRAKRIYVLHGSHLPSAEKVVCGEVVLWKRLKHPNLVPLLGVTLKPLLFVTEWMPNGDLPEYLEKHPNADRVQLLSDVAAGLSYLHSRDVIHKQIMGQNVLVDADGRARITDFGLRVVHPSHHRMDPYGYGYLPRWDAPEVMETEVYTKAADIFSFAMVMVEAFTGAIPYSDLSIYSHNASMAILCGVRPPRPIHPGMTEPLWELMQRCWDQEPGLRPETAEVLEILLVQSVSHS